MGDRRIAWRAGRVVAAALLVAGACSPAVEPLAPTAPGAPGSADTGGVTAVGSGPGADRPGDVPGTVELPLSALRAGDSDAERAATVEAEQALIAECMAERGYVYPPPGAAGEGGPAGDTAGPGEPPPVTVDPDFARALGGDDGDWVAILAPDGTPTGTLVPPEDSCVGQAEARLYGAYDRFVSLVTLSHQIGYWVVEAGDAAFADPSVQSLLDEWAACMRDAGWFIDDDAADTYRGLTSTVPDDVELALDPRRAAAETCADDTGFGPAFTALRSRFERQIYDEHDVEIQTYLELRDTGVREAARVLGDPVPSGS